MPQPSNILRLLSLALWLMLCPYSITAQGEGLSKEVILALQGSCGHRAVENKPKLSLESEVLAFFRNNEYEEQVIRDYTLPGYRLRANLTYTPASKHSIELRLGLSNNYYWGSHIYPTAFAYTDLPYWSDEGYQYTRFRLLPFVQASIRPAKYWQVRLGSFGHPTEIIDPLYNEELRLTADLPAGTRITYHSPKTLVDMWVDWQSFIYKRAKHPEVFVFGLNAEQSLVRHTKGQLKLHLQSITAHRGGVHNTVPDTVHTQCNLALGLSYHSTVSVGRHSLSSTSSAYALGYIQRGGHYPRDKGWGLYLQEKLQYRAWAMGLDVFYGRGYIAPYGNPFAQVINEDRQFYNRSSSASYLHWYLGYRVASGRSYDFGAKLGLWHHPHTEKSVSHYLALQLTIHPHIPLL